MMKTSKLIGPALDWAAAKCDPNSDPLIRLHQNSQGATVYFHEGLRNAGVPYRPSTDWAQGGPIIEREKIELRRGNPLYFPQGNEHGDYYEPLWIAGKQHGTTPLVAAMRCYVASQLGDEVEIPEELR